MFLTVNRHFSLVQPHFLASLGRTIESGKDDNGQTSLNPNHRGDAETRRENGRDDFHGVPSIICQKEHQGRGGTRPYQGKEILVAVR